MGDKSILILESIASNNNKFDPEVYSTKWLSVWPTEKYAATYKDSAYKQTKKHIESGKSVLAAGSTDDDIGHQSQSYILLPINLHDEKHYMKQAAELVQLCQANPHFIVTGQFFAAVIYRLIHSNGTVKPTDVIKQVTAEFNNRWLSNLINHGLSNVNQDSIQYAESIGTSCSTEFGLPEVIQIVTKYEDQQDPFDAIRVNNDIGGNSVSRGFGIASILYAYRINSIEHSKIWPIAQQIEARQHVQQLLQQITQ